jgi:hypothetical protein
MNLDEAALLTEWQKQITKSAPMVEQHIQAQQLGANNKVRHKPKIWRAGGDQ